MLKIDKLYCKKDYIFEPNKVNKDQQFWNIVGIKEKMFLFKKNETYKFIREYKPKQYEVECEKFYANSGILIDYVLINNKELKKYFLTLKEVRTKKLKKIHESRR